MKAALSGIDPGRLVVVVDERGGMFRVDNPLRMRRLIGHWQSVESTYPLWSQTPYRNTLEVKLKGCFE